ncbi:hypothetical protein BB559_001760 [Furculomyces boomerangus]|uniref:Large ribosomal subunit protein mL53 n=2 Tax=Harpellales TaxID=61421 RepID=A0A2T9Z0P3_9FUNG|nr:hypothetical protein BB559_001760 [Furculomyces boomerangus]PVZ99290.1 hypothetical protein BB558_004701 [Smittium angustum]
MLKQVKKVIVELTPFKKSSVSSRVFLNRLMTKHNLAVNPNCNIKINTDHPHNLPPTLLIEFKNGQLMNLNPTKHSGDELYTSVYKIGTIISKN